MKRLSSIRSPWTIAGAVIVAAALGAGITSMQTRAAAPASPHDTRDVQAISSAKELSHAFRFAAETAGPSVVKIHSHTGAKKVSGVAGMRGLQQNPFKGTPFEDMFPNGMPDGEMPNRMPERDGIGSGVIIDTSGIVLTNNHVVQGADDLTVTLADGREFKATDVKTDPQTDLAVIRLTGASNLPAANLGNSDDLEIGDWVLAIGCPFELDHTVSAGIISGKGRTLSDVSRAQFLQTDAAINPGNSGGPLVNIDGEVVGINTAIASNSGGYEGIGFSIPINTAKFITQQLIANGHVSRGYLGVQMEDITPELAQKFGVKQDEGVLVADVMPNTPAAAAGVHSGDVITSFAGTAIRSPRDLRELVERTTIGSKQSLQVNRDGKNLALSVTLAALPDSLAGPTRMHRGRQQEENSESTFKADKLGLEVSDMTADETATFRGYEGVVIRDVTEGSSAAEKGLQPGMLIVAVGRTPVKNVKQIEAALGRESSSKSVLLQVRDGEGNHFVVLQQS